MLTRNEWKRVSASNSKNKVLDRNLYKKPYFRRTCQVKTANKHDSCSEVLDFIKSHPHILLETLSHPISLKVVYSARKKKYTEFYRIMVNTYGTAKEKEIYYWIRILKNKPFDTILEALNKQFSLMTKVFNYFAANTWGKLHLSCCKPIALLPEFRALVTRECVGDFFNSYLQKKLPIVSKNEILAHFFNCGVWLKGFHECFKDNLVSTSDLQEQSDRFKKRFGRYPHTDLHYLTYCHNDFSPRNIFVTKDSVEVIDYVGVEKGFPEEDIYFFENYVMKARFNLLYPRRLKKQMIAMFHKGYKTGLGIEPRGDVLCPDNEGS